MSTVSKINYTFQSPGGDTVDHRGEQELLKMRQDDRRLLEEYNIDAGLMRDYERQERGGKV